MNLEWVSDNTYQQLPMYELHASYISGPCFSPRFYISPSFFYIFFLYFFFFLNFLSSSWSKFRRKGNFENFTKSKFFLFFILFFDWNLNLKVCIRIVSFCWHIYLIITSINSRCAFNFLLSRINRCSKEKKKIKKKEDNKKLTRIDIPAFSSEWRYVNARKLAAGIRPSNR